MSSLRTWWKSLRHPPCDSTKLTAYAVNDPSGVHPPMVTIDIVHKCDGSVLGRARYSPDTANRVADAIRRESDLARSLTIEESDHG